MKFHLFIMLCFFGWSCQNQEQSTCTISKTEEIFNDYIDSILIIKSPEEVLPIVEEHLKEYPDNMVSINNLGAIKYMIYKKSPTRDRNLESELFDIFNLVLTYCPNYKASLANLIEANYDFDNYEKSIEIAEKYLTVHPENSAIMTRISDSYRELSDFENSLKYAERGIALDSTCSFCYTLKGIALLELEKSTEGISVLKFSENLKPNQMNNLFLGIAYKEAGNPGLAIEYYKKAIELDSTRILTFLSLAELYRKNGAISLACKYYQEGFSKNYSKYNLRALRILRKEKARFKNLCAT